MRVRLSVQQLLFLVDVALDGPLHPRKTRYVDEYRTASALQRRGLIEKAFVPVDSRNVTAYVGFRVTDAGKQRLGLADA